MCSHLLSCGRDSISQVSTFLLWGSGVPGRCGIRNFQLQFALKKTCDRTHIRKLWMSLCRGPSHQTQEEPMKLTKSHRPCTEFGMKGIRCQCPFHQGRMSYNQTNFYSVLEIQLQKIEISLGLEPSGIHYFVCTFSPKKIESSQVNK